VRFSSTPWSTKGLVIWTVRRGCLSVAPRGVPEATFCSRQISRQRSLTISAIPSRTATLGSLATVGPNAGRAFVISCTPRSGGRGRWACPDFEATTLPVQPPHQQGTSRLGSAMGLWTRCRSRRDGDENALLPRSRVGYSMRRAWLTAASSVCGA
jgi:hypothetical protein